MNKINIKHYIEYFGWPGSSLLDIQSPHSLDRQLYPLACQNFSFPRPNFLAKLFLFLLASSETNILFN